MRRPVHLAAESVIIQQSRRITKRQPCIVPQEVNAPMVYLAAVLLALLNSFAWLTTFITLPGNWILLLFTVLYAYFLPPDYYPRVSWTVVIVVAVLAVVGEVVEFLAGAAGAAKQGGSRWGVFLSIVGAFIGSLTGAVLLSFIPLLGTMIGALLGGALGAFGGAWLGEHKSEKTREERMAIGQGAFLGRILGTVGKLIVGVMMLVLVTLDSFFDLKREPIPEQVPAKTPVTYFDNSKSNDALSSETSALKSVVRIE